MKRFLAVLTLTAPEQRVVILLMSIVLGVTAARTYRAEKPAKTPVAVQPSPSPGILP